MMMTMMIMIKMIKMIIAVTQSILKLGPPDLHGIRYKWYLLENYDDDDTNDDNYDNDDDNDHYSCNSATRSHKAHLLELVSIDNSTRVSRNLSSPLWFGLAI